MKKTALSTLIAAGLLGTSLASHASGIDKIGVGVGYEVVSGATLELNYPINDIFLVRGSLSRGAGYSLTESEDNVNYKAKADGGINRLALNYHPFKGAFFLSAGYAFNDFSLNVDGAGTGSIKVGSESFDNASLKLKGVVEWDSAPTLSLGWGHSPSSGWGLMTELGVIFTGTPGASLTGTGSYDNGGGPVDVSSDPTFQNALKAEERKLQKDIADASFLPILQIQATYRF